MKTFSRVIFSILIVSIIASFSFVSVFAQAPTTNSVAAILVDADGSNALYEKNADQKLAPASTTKLMTLLLAAEYGKMNEQIIVDYSLFSTLPGDASIAYYQQDEVTTVEAAFMAAYLTSANDAAMLLANHIGGSVDNFVKLMNDRAKELGCKSTNFVNPTGLYNEEHYTTVRDMSIIAKAVVQNKTACELMKKYEYTLPQGPTRPEALVLKSTNALLDKESSFYYPSVIFGKTGYTDGSKHTLVTVAAKDNTTLIAVAFQTDERAFAYDDVRNMLDHGFGDFYRLTLTKAELTNLFSGKRGEMITVENDIKLMIPASVKRDSLTRKVESSNGEVFVSLTGDGFDFSQKIADIEKKKGASTFFGNIFGSMWWFIKWLFKIILWIVMAVVALYLILAIYVNAKNRRKRRRRKMSRGM